MKTPIAAGLAAALSGVLLTGCGSNHGNGPTVTTNDASSAPVCRLGTTSNGQCLSPAPYPAPSTTATPHATTAHCKRHPKRNSHCRH